ncbi:aldehyde dehydrogenase family protein, partial [Paracidovorax wautersii]|uniref:aldehyde dehydrogenase family protein n=1 Tax=Paracidovorax wautersii TaxID=1177982 RepID=UPI0031D5ABE2
MNSSDILKRLIEAGRLDRFYIDGQWTLPSGQGRAPVTDPSTEQVVAEIAMGDSQDVAQAVGAARRSFAEWSAMEPQARGALLDRLHGLILERAEVFAQMISLEMGSSITAARNAQVPVAAEHIRVARDLAGSYAFVMQRDGMAIVREAIGVCGLITPWNWPLYQITAKVGPALAA